MDIVEISARQRVIFTDKALEKMRKHGLYRNHILDTLKYGQDTALFHIYQKPLQQKRYRIASEKEVEVVFRIQRKTVDEIVIINCWMRKVW